jgi:GR25 family glycosyltransferase involved in LPS biosynthesis
MALRVDKTASDPEANLAISQRIRPAKIQGIDQIWLINLDRRRDRLERFMQRHPEMSGRINRLPAYDGKSLKLTPTLARLFLPNNFEWHKPTMGCSMSHLALWYKLVGEADENASYLILEDDALLDSSWVAKVEKAFLTDSVPADWEVIFLGGILPKYRETLEKNVQPVNRMVARVNPECIFGSNPTGYFHFCAYAYLLNKRGAQRLLDLVEIGNGVWMQADFFACYTTPELYPPRPVYFFHPLLAQSFQDSADGFVRPYDDGTDHSDKVDSDIWKNHERFSPEKVAACSVDGLPLDIPGGLGLEPLPNGRPPAVSGKDSLPRSFEALLGNISYQLISGNGPKLFGLYALDDIPNLEENHRSFAEQNGLDYAKYRVRNIYEKWSLIYRLLEANRGQTLVFIDCFSYFVSPRCKLDTSETTLIQEAQGKIMDNFFVVKSTHETQRIFHNILLDAQSTFAGGSFLFEPRLPQGIAKPYGWRTDEGLHFNVDPVFTFHGRYLSAAEIPHGLTVGLTHSPEDPQTAPSGNTLVLRYGGTGWDAQFWTAAEILCEKREAIQAAASQACFEVLNPGRPKALLSLSCSEPGMPPAEYAAVSDRNFREYAERQNVTLYLYKAIPEELKGLHSTWTKPYLVLRHLAEHEYLSWVDADILISRNFQLPEAEDVIVYNDPGAWLFNAGFMTFRNSAKTVEFLHAVISRSESIEDRSSLYVNGGDQTQFIEEFRLHFPDSLPLSNLVANIPVVLDAIRSPGPGLWHFMGLNPPSVRAVVMDYYEKNIVNDHIQPADHR